MNSRFVLPAMVSTAFYALVFSLGNGTHVRPPVTPPTTRAAAPLPMVVKIVDPEDDVVPDRSTSPNAGGSTEKAVFRPPSEDPPRLPGNFTQPVDRIIVRDGPTIPMTTIPTDWANSKVIGGPHDILPSSMLDNEPRERVRVAPVYPDEARRQGLSGAVLVDFVVDTTGRVTHVQIIRSSNVLFDGPTLRAVERWRFEPGKRDGHLVPFRMSVPVVFGLDNS